LTIIFLACSLNFWVSRTVLFDLLLKQPLSRIAMARGSATVNSTYCSQVIFETSIVTCARAGRIAKATSASASANKTRLNCSSMTQGDLEK
jgi:hypothetical protein